jgi:WD40 repeat protein
MLNVCVMLTAAILVADAAESGRRLLPDADSVKVRQPETDAGRAAVFSPDEKWFATSDGYDELHLYEVTTGGRRRLQGPVLIATELSTTGYMNDTSQVTFALDSATLAQSSALKGHVHVWEVKTGRHLRKLGDNDAHLAPLRRGRFLMVANQVAMATEVGNGKVKTFKTKLEETGEAVLPEVGQPRGDLVVGRARAIYSDHGVLALWRVGDDLTLLEELRTEARVGHVRFSGDGMRVYLLTENGQLGTWDLASRKLAWQPLPTFVSTDGAIEGPVAISGDGRRIATSRSDHVDVFDPISGRRTRYDIKKECGLIAISPEVHILALDCDEGPQDKVRSLLYFARL